MSGASSKGFGDPEQHVWKPQGGQFKNNQECHQQINKPAVQAAGTDP